MPARILVVDDDKQIVRLLQAYLEQAGLAVLTANDGETALHVIHRERPDLVVLDLGLPAATAGRHSPPARRRAHRRFAISCSRRVDDGDKLLVWNWARTIM